MTWSVGKYVEHAEIDCRERGRVTGLVWLRGLEGPVRLNLEGSVDEDLDGHCLRFTNPLPETMPENQRGFRLEQRGLIAEMTAARKTKVFDFPVEVLEELGQAKIEPSASTPPARKNSLSRNGWTPSKPMPPTSMGRSAT